MSKVYWDTMLFIYLLEANQRYGSAVRSIHERMQVRGDSLYTSYLTLGEIVAGAPQSRHAVREGLSAMNVEFLPFDGGAVDTFGWLRARQKLATADSIHLACAAAKGIDLFLTGDKQLVKQIVPGIQFISSIENSPI